MVNYHTLSSKFQEITDLKVKAYAKISTEELIDRIKAGDQEAFNFLIVKYEKLIWKIIHDEVGKLNDAADIFQDVSLAIWRGIGKIIGVFAFFHPSVNRRAGV